MTKEETFDEAMEAIEAAYSTFNNGMLDCTRTRHRFRLNPKAAEIADFKEMIDDYIRTLLLRRITPVFRHGDIRRIRRKTDVPTVFA